MMGQVVFQCFLFSTMSWIPVSEVETRKGSHLINYQTKKEIELIAIIHVRDTSKTVRICKEK